MKEVAKERDIAMIGILLMILLLGSIAHWVLSINAQEISEYGILVRGDEKVLIEDANLILTGNITVKDDGILILKRSTVQLSIRGEEDYNVTISGKGKIILENSKLTSLSKSSYILLKDAANLTLVSGSSLNGFTALHCNGTAAITIWDGELRVERIWGIMNVLELKDSKLTGEVNLDTIKLYASNLTSSIVKVNCTDALIFDSKFESLTLNVSNLVELSRVDAGDTSIYSLRGLRLRDSSFKSLTLGGKGEAYNVITKSGLISETLETGGQIYALPNSTIRRFWYLNVTVTDIAGVTVPAEIYLYYLNGTKAFEAKANILGKAYMPVLAEIVNSSKTLFVGNYIVEATYQNHSTSLQLTMDSNKEIELRFNDVVPIPTTTYLKVSRLEVRVGEKLKISGWIEPRIEGELVEITYKRPDGGELKKAVMTGEGGGFVDEFTPDIPGTWTIYADWLGGSSYVKDKQTISRPIIFLVKPRPPIRAIIIRVMPILIIVVVLIIGLAYISIQRRKAM